MIYPDKFKNINKHFRIAHAAQRLYNLSATEASWIVKDSIITTSASDYVHDLRPGRFYGACHIKLDARQSMIYRYNSAVYYTGHEGSIKISNVIMCSGCLIVSVLKG